MSRRPLDPAGSRAISCLFPPRDIEIIERVAHHYSVSLAAAIRLMIRAGAPKLDPSAPAGDLKNDH